MERPASTFHGLSTLRQAEKKPAVVSAEQLAKQAYLAKMYGGGGGGSDAPPAGEKKKKKKKARAASVPGAVQIVEEDLTGFASGHRDAAPPSDEEDEGEMPARCRPVRQRGVFRPLGRSQSKPALPRTALTPRR